MAVRGDEGAIITGATRSRTPRIETPSHRVSRRPGIASRLYRSLAEQFAALLIRELSDRLTAVVLYGSVARGTARRESDIDLFVVAGETDEEKESIWHRIWNIEDEFWDSPEAVALRERGYRASVETFVYSKPQARRGAKLYLDMALEAIVLHDPEGFFTHRMEQVKQRMLELKSYREWVEHDLYFWQLKGDAKPGEVFSVPYIEEATG
ncbi:MAG: nucleotidyltransferase domain-containing protein [Chloroflexi bacterium]|nr:nucleotidyltransferase domain-containing protein [Chloroflexota bacterium]